MPSSLLQGAALALLAVVPAAAQGPSSSPTPSVMHGAARPFATLAPRRVDAPAPRVRGVVADSAGRPLANVQIVVGGINRTTSTNDEGVFILVGMPPGTYHADALLIGYRRADFAIVVPESGPDVVVKVTMAATTLRLSGVQVTASPIGADPLDITQSTVELSGAELQRALATSIAQTLSGEPGLAVRYNGAAATPVIRGLSGERILVLQDGDRAGDLSSAAADHGLSIDPNTAQRIEVVRGPASLLYGTNALGGVVNVITNDIPTAVPQHVEGMVGAQTESASPGQAVSVGITAPLSSTWALSARGSERNAQNIALGGGGSLANSFNRNWNGMLALGYAGDDVHAGLAYKRYDFTYGLPGAAGDPELGAQIRGSRDELRFRSDRAIGDGWLSYVRLDGTAQWYQHAEYENTGEVGTRFDLKTQTVNLTGKTRLNGWDGAIGMQGLFRQYASAGAEALTPAANTSGVGLFLFQDVPLTDWKLAPHLQLGARYDLITITSQTGDPKFGAGRSISANNASGSIGVTWPLADGVSVAVNGARAFRAPSVEELYSNAFHAAAGSYDIGNPNLVPEVNTGAEAVLRVQRGTIDAQVAIFRSNIDHYIAPNFVGDTLVGSGPDTARVPINRFRQGDATTWGVEARVEANVGHDVVVGVMGDFVRGEFTTANEFLPFMPAPRAGVNARWSSGPWTLGGDVRYARAQWRVTGGDDVPTDSYTLANLQGSYSLSAGGHIHTFSVRVDNLGDVSYRDAASRIKAFAPAMGRNVSLSYRVLF
jgi:iron complex outermembrane receptor protein